MRHLYFILKFMIRITALGAGISFGPTGLYFLGIEKLGFDEYIFLKSGS